MQPSCGMIFMFLLVKLQWNKGSTASIEVHLTNNGNSSVTDNYQSTVQTLLLRSVLPATTATDPSAISHVVSTTANTKEKVTEGTAMSSWPNSTALRSTDSSTLSSNVIVASKDGRSSATSFNRVPMSLATFTTIGDFSGETKTATATSTETLTNSTVTYSTPSAALLPSDNSSINPITLHPTGLALTSPMVKQDSPTPNFNSTQEATELNHDFINLSTASPHSKDAREDKTNKGGIIGGVIVGFIVVSMLIIMIGYFMCGKKRSESFSHRRLYDDTRNDPEDHESGPSTFAPHYVRKWLTGFSYEGRQNETMMYPVYGVLHLDNSLGPYDMSFGYASDDKTCIGDKAEEDNTTCPSDGIPMADMTSSHPSL